MMMAEKPTEHPEHLDSEDEGQHGQFSVAGFFAHHWPLVFFVGLFLAMMIFGLIFAGVVEGYSEIPIHALILSLGFAVGFVLMVFAPRLMGVYLTLFAALYLFVLRPLEWHWNTSGPYLSLIFLLLCGFGTFVVFGRALLGRD